PQRSFVRPIAAGDHLLEVRVLGLDHLVGVLAGEPKIAGPAEVSTCHRLHRRRLQACAMRTRLPDGSRKAQSRAPHGWDVGSWSTSAPDARTFSNVVSRSSERKIAAWSEPFVTSCRRASPSTSERPPWGWNRTMSTS